MASRHAGGAFLHAYITHLSQNHKVDLICTTEPEPRTVATYDGWVGVHFARPLRPGGRAACVTGSHVNRVQYSAHGEVDGLSATRLPVASWLTADIVDIQWAELLRALPLVRRDRGRKPIVVTEHDVYARGIIRLARSRSNDRGAKSRSENAFLPRSQYSQRRISSPNAISCNCSTATILRCCGVAAYDVRLPSSTP